MPKRNLATGIRKLKMPIPFDMVVLLLELDPKNAIQNF